MFSQARQLNAPPPNTREGSASAPERTPTPGDNATQNNLKNEKKMRASINIATLNMNGIAAPSSGLSLTEKWSMVNQTLNKFKIAVLALQETHLDKERAEMIRRCFEKKMELLYFADPTSPRATAGVTFVINKSLIAPKDLKLQVLHARRAISLEIKWLESEKTTLLNIYAPIEKATHLTFWENIEAKRRALRAPVPGFMLGNFNVTEDPIDRMPARLDDQAAIEALRELRQIWGIQDAWRDAFPNDRSFTYRAIHQEKKRLQPALPHAI
jgi:exonuclease III